MKKVEEEFETFIKSQLRTFKAQMDIIKEYINRYEERNIRLKKTISNELIEVLIKRFERNEKIISEFNEKLDSIDFKLREQLSRAIKDLREELSEAELSRAISKIFEEKEVKISSKPLDELRKI